MSPHRPLAGHTLLELLVVLVVLGIVASLAVPSLREQVLRQRLRGALDQVVAEVYTARALAARSGTDLRVRLEPREADCANLLVVEEASSRRQLRTVDLAAMAPGVCVSIRSRAAMRINKWGMPTNSARTVLARQGARADSVRISLVGRVLRSGYVVRWG